MFSWPCAAATGEVHLFITSDIHGWVSSEFEFPKRKKFGLGYLFSKILQFQKEFPEGLLIDAGDFLSGSLSSYYWLDKSTGENPLMQLMEKSGYDFIALGNHDLEQFHALEKGLKRYPRFRVYSANVHSKQGALFSPYKIIRVGKFKVALIAMTTPGVLYWTNPEILKNFSVENIKSASYRVLKEIESKFHPDLSIGVFHSGFNPYRDLETSKIYGVGPANALIEVLKLRIGFDFIISGHDHRAYPNSKSRKVPRIKNTPYVSIGALGKNATYVRLVFNTEKQSGRKVEIAEAELIKPSSKRLTEEVLSEETRQKLLRYAEEKTAFRFPEAVQEGKECLEKKYIRSIRDFAGMPVIIPPLNFQRMKFRPGRFISRRDLYQMIPYQNTLFSVALSYRDLQFLFEKQIHPRYNERLVFSGLQSSDSRHFDFSERFLRKRRYALSSYHAAGGGGLIGSLFVNRENNREIGKLSIREIFFRFLNSDEGALKCPNLPNK